MSLGELQDRYDANEFLILQDLSTTLMKLLRKFKIKKT